MWVFVLGDLVIFAIYFIVFMVCRAQNRDLYLASQRHLSLTAGALNTLVLLASSRFIALSVQAVRGQMRDRAIRLTFAAGACGLVFMGLKGYEWYSLASDGHTLPSNGFFMFYYMLTGVHLLHVLLGLIILGVVVRELRTPALGRVWVVETGATFWHMVDLLWIVIFALLYVMR
jgi:nitric oxide reductase NorE protein